MNANPLDSMSFDQLVPSDSKFLKKEDVGEDGVILTISHFSTQSVKGDDGVEEQKVVLNFAEAGMKPMILNKTNSQLLAIATGARTAGDARGKKVIVYCDPSVSFGGRVIGGIRIKKIPGPARAPAAPAARKPAPAPAAREPGSDDDFNDTIDFG
jgi:hypothetical protein